MNLLEKDPAEEQRALNRVRQQEEERIQEQERMYQVCHASLHASSNAVYLIPRWQFYIISTIMQ